MIQESDEAQGPARIGLPWVVLNESVGPLMRETVITLLLLTPCTSAVLTTALSHLLALSLLFVRLLTLN